MLNRAGQMLLIEQKSGFPTETDEGLFTNKDQRNRRRGSRVGRSQGRRGRRSVLSPSHPKIKFDKICITNQFFNRQAQENAALNGVKLLDQRDVGILLARYRPSTSATDQTIGHWEKSMTVRSIFDPSKASYRTIERIITYGTSEEGGLLKAEISEHVVTESISLYAEIKVSFETKED